ncbi:MAG: hypothetical protein ACE5PV_25320, partial [Candidatus Poribacteria bacterium]
MRKYQLVVLIFCGLFGMASISLAAGGKWVRKADMPTARLCLRTSVVAGKIYAIGGTAHWVNGPILSTVEEYNPVKDIWTKKKDMPTSRYKLTTSVVDRKIYAIGGFPTNSTVEEYNPVADTWT